ncbi:MAG: hypothetical protein NT062_14560, partial [Proteobacteria bacterium]|nr:hypothetical protein [Pseudomonadota bacterium]
ATPPAPGPAGVRDDGQVLVCPDAAGDDEVVVAIADARVPARVAELRISFHADAAATTCSVEDFLDTGGCCSASGDRSSMLLAIAVAAVMRRRRRW